MSWSDEDREFLEFVNSVKIPAALFHDAVRAVADPGEDAHVSERGLRALYPFFEERGYTQSQVFPLAKAVAFRIEALQRLRSEPGVLEWDVPSGPTADDGHDPFLVAAAEEPLIEHVEHGLNEFAFDRERFRVRMLSLES